MRCLDDEMVGVRGNGLDGLIGRPPRRKRGRPSVRVRSGHRPAQECACRPALCPRTVRLSAELPLEWKRQPFKVGELMTRGYGYVRNSAGIAEEGVGYVVTLTNTATMEQLYLDDVCEWPGENLTFPD